jgi:2-keto-4-pentenoate hydratase/2-oxohepta-3-ene-1,7-dioic acid hydratase in catechol pathway
VVKLATYAVRGETSFGAVVGDGIVDLRRRLGAARFPSVKAVLAAGALEEARRAASGAEPDHRLADVALRPPVPDPDKILCVGLNYKAHREETGRKPSDHPSIFTRFASTQVGSGEPLVKPKNSEAFDFEGELAVVIGERGRHVPRSRALDLVAGYSVYFDGSVRDWQRHTTQWTPGKNFPATGGFGPWLVTADEVPDPTALTLVTRLDGSEVQRTATDLMLFDIPAILEYLTGFCELAPGDVVATGTPGGVGYAREPPLFMRPGARVEVEISGIGVLRHEVVAEGA